MKRIITVKGIQYEIFQSESGCFVAIESDYCEEEFLFFLRKNLPDNIDKIPKMIDFISRMYSEFYKK